MNCELSVCEKKEEEVELDAQDLFWKHLQSGDLEKVQTLLQTGNVKVNILNKKGYHPLHIVCINGNVELLEYIWTFYSIEEQKEAVNVKDWSGLTPLHYTANEGWLECAQFLLEHGAEVNVVNEDAMCYFGGMNAPLYVSGGKTPLHLAAEKGEIDIVIELLKYNPKTDLLDNDGNTAYTLALLNNRSEIATLLRPSFDAPIQMDKTSIEAKNKEDYQKRSERIKLKEKQKKEQQKLDILARYQPLYPQLFQLKEEFFEESFLAAVNSNSKEKMMSILKEETNRVFSFQMLKPDFCNKLIEEAAHYEQSGLPIDRPNSMNNYGLILNEIGFQKMFDEMLQKYIAPFARELYADYGGTSLDSHHTFIVRYKLNEDVSLDTHVDDADITLNVCLGKSFTGGTLTFYGIKGTDSENNENVEIGHHLGRALLHVGKHIHGANKILSGERINLIIWCRSSSFRSQLSSTESSQK